jgi:predicted transcriptional regulator
MAVEEIEIRIGRNAPREIAEWLSRPEDWDKEPRKVIYVESISMLSTILSTEKLKLLNLLGMKKEVSVNEIARKLKRPREAVSRDLHLLSEKGIVRLEKKGRETRPKIQVERIVIPIVAKSRN